MPKIVLDVSKQNKDIVLNILNNLKEGLINSIEIDKKRVLSKKIDNIEPLTKTPKPVLPTTSKYIDPQTFKARLKAKRLNKN